RVSAALRSRVLRSALDLGPVALGRHRTGALALLATRGVAAAEPYLTRYLPALVTAAVLPALTVVAIATQDLASALVVVLTLPLVPVFAVLVGMTTRDKAAEQYAALGSLAGHFLDVVRGLPTLVAHRRARAQSRTIAAVTDRYRRASSDTLRLAFASSGVLELVATISVALVAVLVGLRLAGGGLELQVALTVLLLAPEAYWPLRRVGAEFHAAAEGTATLEAVMELVSEPAATPGTAAPVGGPLDLAGLTLTWPGRRTPAVTGLDAHLPARGLTALVGPSGSGKSTVLAALLGELAPSAGSLTLGGTPLEAVDQEAWRGQVAWLPQRPWLLGTTVGDNVRLGRPDADEAAVWAALEAVDLATTVAAMPAGLETALGEDGAGLSAGQRARLALARVVVSDRPWVLLDEPSAHLDAATEDVVVRTLRTLALDRAVVVVAHRDAVVMAADQVVALPAPDALVTVDDSAVPAERPSAPRPVVGADTLPEPRPARPFSGLGADLLGALAATCGVALTATAGWLIVRASEQPPVLMLMVAIVGVRAFGIGRPFFRYLERLGSHDLALRELARRRVAVYDALVPLVPGALGRRRGDLLASVVDDVDAVVDQRLRVRQPLLVAVLVSVLASVFATTVLPEAGVVVAAASLGGIAVAYALGRLVARRAERAAVTARGLLSEQVEAVLHGARDLRMWQADTAALADLAATDTRLGAAGERSVRGTATARALVTVLTGTAVVGVAALGAPALAAGTLSGPMLALLVLMPLALADVVAPAADAGALHVRTRAARERLEALTSRAPRVQDPVAPVLAPDGHPALVAEAVTAGWGDVPAFSGLDLDLSPGTRLGVVGPSGSGKSTLAAVLLRFIDPQQGAVRLDDTDLRDLALDDVRSTVGLVDDDPYVFGSTLFENVRLARPGASEPEVLEAVRRAGLAGWVGTLPDGIHTRLGDGAAAVSGGERARIGLARAVLADQRVLVLDEPTAHLDAATAADVTADLLADTDRTIVWITHGTIGLDAMDRILQLGQEPAGQGALPVSSFRD
ncbi:MAG: thiol reductant ABC exporter subunit CydD, partial [Nocardioides sp.]|nr:thiol reductant ABC exporter subunit CydD [Nocardioides sp.]